MRSLLFFFLFSGICLHAEENDDAQNKEKIERLSEYMGFCFARELQHMKLPCDVDAIALGMKAFVEGVPCDAFLQDNAETLDLVLQIQADLFEKKAAENHIKTQEFFNSLSRDPEVHVLIDQQLYYKILKSGEGSQTVEQTSQPLVYYSANTFENVKIANTFEEKRPVRIPLKTTISGFAKGVAGMKKNERRLVYVHPDLAYKRGGLVPPNSVLIFDIEVVEIDN